MDLHATNISIKENSNPNLSNNSYVENGLQIFFNGIFLLVYAFLQEIPRDFNRNISRMRIHPSTSTCHSRSARQTFILCDVAYLRLLISVIIHSKLEKREHRIIEVQHQIKIEKICEGLEKNDAFTLYSAWMYVQ